MTLSFGEVGCAVAATGSEDFDCMLARCLKRRLLGQIASCLVKGTLCSHHSGTRLVNIAFELENAISAPGTPSIAFSCPLILSGNWTARHCCYAGNTACPYSPLSRDQARGLEACNQIDQTLRFRLVATQSVNCTVRERVRLAVVLRELGATGECGPRSHHRLPSQLHFVP